MEWAGVGDRFGEKLAAWHRWAGFGWRSFDGPSLGRTSLPTAHRRRPLRRRLASGLAIPAPSLPSLPLVDFGRGRSR